jgi:predicted metal-dependent HD superfamily phosphohydrolase
MAPMLQVHGTASRGDACVPDPASIAELLQLLPVSGAARQALHHRLAGPERHYHGLDHVALLWQRHGVLGAGLALTRPPWHRLIGCAIAFHDAIYDATRQDNEAASAALWRAAQPALPPAEIEWVAGTILATANHLAARPDPGMSDEAWSARLWMLDLDLSPLGEAPAAFIANTAQLRAEYAHLTETQWEEGRLAFLRGLTAQPALFRSPAIAARFEAAARANLARELAAAG